MRGVIHRDLKPANIRLDTRGKPILVDFGLAKLDADAEDLTDGYQAMTQTGQFVGSMPWASPEQAAGEHASVDVRSDVYSLGVILYQLLTGGRFPYRVIGSVREVLDAILYADPTRPSEWGRRVSDELETIVLKALSKPRERRYQSAGEFGRDIRRYLAGEPIEAKRDSAWYVLSKTIQRHKAPTGVAATLVAASLVLSVVLGPLYARAEQAENRANQSLARAEASGSDVRDLVRTFMFDFHEEIRNLSGATDAREILLTNAVKYLDLLEGQLSDRNANDSGYWELIAEVAEAHDQVGVLYAGSHVASTGNTEAAGRHFFESRRLREVLLAAKPNSAAVLIGLGKNGEHIAQWMQRSGRFLEAAETAVGARARFAQAAERDPLSTQAQLGAVRTLKIEGDQHRRLIASTRSLDGAREHADTAIDLFADAHDRAQDLIAAGIEAPEDEPLKAPHRERAIAILYTALTQLELANRFHEAARTADDDDRDDFETKAREARAPALENAADALADMTAIAAANPEVQGFRNDVVVAHHTLGLAYERLARGASDPVAKQAAVVEANGLYDTALELARRLVNEDYSNLEAQRNLSLVLSRKTTLMTQAEAFDDAEAFGAEMVDLRERVALTDPTFRHTRDLAVAEFKLGEIAQKRSEQDASFGPTRVASLDEARSWYRRSLDRFTGLQAAGGQAAAEIDELEGLITKIEGQLVEAR